LADLPAARVQGVGAVGADVARHAARPSRGG
jgi:hypothetical protein